MRHALDSLAVVAPTWLLQHARSEWKQRYEHRIQEYRLPASKPERVALAETIGADGFALLSAIDCGVAPAWLREVPAVQPLRRVWIQQFHAPNGPVRWRTNFAGAPTRTCLQPPC